MDLMSWTHQNLSSSFGNFSIPHWASIFPTACYLLWQWRNIEFFDNDFSRPSNMVKDILSYAKTIIDAKGGQVLSCKQKNIRDIKWMFPPDGWCKLNTDGSSKGNPGIGGCRGLLRDDSGSWIVGFVINLGRCTSYIAEMWGILQGLEVACLTGIRRLVVESDSATIIDLLRNGRNSPTRNSCLLRIFEWLEKDWQPQLVHTFREGNVCADWLANWSIS